MGNGARAASNNLEFRLAFDVSKYCNTSYRRWHDDMLQPSGERPG